MILADVHIKKVDRGAFLSEVEKGAELKHADTVDKSVPKVDGTFFLFCRFMQFIDLFMQIIAKEDINLHRIDRAALLNDIKKQDQ